MAAFTQRLARLADAGKLSGRLDARRKELRAEAIKGSHTRTPDNAANLGPVTLFHRSRALAQRLPVTVPRSMRHGPQPTPQEPRNTPRLRLSGHAFHAA